MGSLCYALSEMWGQILLHLWYPFDLREAAPHQLLHHMLNKVNNEAPTVLNCVGSGANWGQNVSYCLRFKIIIFHIFQNLLVQKIVVRGMHEFLKFCSKRTCCFKILDDWRIISDEIIGCCSGSFFLLSPPPLCLIVCMQMVSLTALEGCEKICLKKCSV